MKRIIVALFCLAVSVAHAETETYYIGWEPASGADTWVMYEIVKDDAYVDGEVMKEIAVQLRPDDTLTYQIRVPCTDYNEEGKLIKINRMYQVETWEQGTNHGRAIGCDSVMYSTEQTDELEERYGLPPILEERYGRNKKAHDAHHGLFLYHLKIRVISLLQKRGQSHRCLRPLHNQPFRLYLHTAHTLHEYVS